MCAVCVCVWGIKSNLVNLNLVNFPLLFKIDRSDFDTPEKLICCVFVPN